MTINRVLSSGVANFLPIVNKFRFTGIKSPEAPGGTAQASRGVDACYEHPGLFGVSSDCIGVGPNCSVRPRRGREQRAGCKTHNMMH